MFYDPDLHLFITDDEIFAISHLKPMVQTWRKETLGPALRPDGQSEGTALGYASAIRDPEKDRFNIWYTPHSDSRIRMAYSADGHSWTKKGIVADDWPNIGVDNLHVALPARDVDPWFREAHYVGTAYLRGSRKPGGHRGNIYGMRSLDGEHWQLKQPALLPGIGDRSALALDAERGVYMLTSRPTHEVSTAVQAPKPRKIALWESRDLIHWDDKGIVLRADENDDEGTQIYGMVPFRYGTGYLGFAEIYHQDLERLDTQLAYSHDGLHWQRVRRREVVLPCGGEGAWDSHWVVPTLNPPLISDDRLLMFYIGASTKHGSGARHRRAIGMATLRRDGWVSLEAGRTEGQVVTIELPLEQPMQLEVNVACSTGYFCAEVLHPDGTPIEGYGADAGRLEAADAIGQQMKWGERDLVNPIASGSCRLRFTLWQGSLFSYRWSETRPKGTS